MYGIGIVGYGGFGQFLQAAWRELAEARVVAVADLVPPGKPLEEVRFYQRWQELLTDPEVEIVSVLLLLMPRLPAQPWRQGNTCSSKNPWP